MPRTWPPYLAGERGDPRHHPRGGELVAFGTVGVVFDVERERQGAAVRGISAVIHGVLGLAGTAADAGDGEVVAGHVHARCLGPRQVRGVVGVGVVVALGGLDGGERVSRPGDPCPVDGGTVRVLVGGHVDAPHHCGRGGRCRPGSRRDGPSWCAGPARCAGFAWQAGLAERAGQLTQQLRRMRGCDVEPLDAVSNRRRLADGRRQCPRGRWQRSCR